MKSLLLIIALLFAVNSFSKTVNGKDYPDFWWTPVSKEGAPDWEILPQEAGHGEVILSKRNELGILSNFAATPVIHNGKPYASVEGFWQSLKYPENANDPRAKFSGIVWKFTREEVTHMNGREAKKAGNLANENMDKMGIGWVTLDGKQIDFSNPGKGEFYELIKTILKEKIEQNYMVKETLKKTGDLILKPDHKMSPDSPPAWRYNEIYQELRRDL